ncbi:hypothetical protein C8R43DRAFT_885126, partial [Mycena crocata]
WCGFDLDDDAVSDMARAWPRLTILELTAVASNVPPRVTLSGLCVFKQYCPHLQSLEIPFDASDVPDRDAISEHIPTDHALAVLGATNCPIAAARPVFEFISVIFPKLSTLRIDYGGWDIPLAAEYNELWKEVELLLPK